jgi:DMSO/TMAO reductase YedYZ molybdopterin-dependent catalytic subunit
MPGGDVTPAPSLQSLLTVTDRPFNAETPLPALEAAVTPAALFYVRCNFDIPALDTSAWRLSVEGRVREPASFTLAELRAMPWHEVHATMECAGNGRSLMAPQPPGTPWGLGAVSSGVFGGTPLRHVLEACGVGDAVEIVFEGADRGTLRSGGIAHFVRSLPLAAALDPDTLLTWTLNDQPLEPAHGFPLRLFIPRWYGIASVKWLTRIVAVSEPLRAHFQTERYIYRGHPEYAAGAPVTFMHVRSLITRPVGGGVLRGAPVPVHGIAWSGFGAIRRVEVSCDDGRSWEPARLSPPASPWSAVSWEHEWVPAGPGEHRLMARAEDATGRIQPLDPVWNELGYGNNAVHRVAVRVEAL